MGQVSLSNTEDKVGSLKVFDEINKKENGLERREEIWLTHSIQILISNVVNLLICKENCFLLHID